MCTQALFDRKWSRRSCSMLFASIVLPNTLAAEAPRQVVSSAKGRTELHVNLEDLFPYMGLRFAQKPDEQNHRETESRQLTDNEAEQPDAFSFDGYTNDLVDVSNQDTVDQLAASPTDSSENAAPTPNEQETVLNDTANETIVPLRRTIVVSNPSTQWQASQWGDVPSEPKVAASASNVPAATKSLDGIPSILGVVDPNQESRDRTEVASPSDRSDSRRAVAKTRRQQPPTTRTDASVLPIGIQSAPHAERETPTRAIPRVHASITSQARQHINSGIQLAQRGAVYSARAEFIKVLRLVSQSLDVETRSNEHSIALANGLRALEEAKQLRPAGSQVEGNVRLARILMAHRTPVLRGQDLAQVSAIEAVQAYHAYADTQLAKAGGRELVAADALFGLAKLQPHLDLSPDDNQRAGPVAMSFYQAALMTYPGHYLAANELGVMFARFGQLDDAREVLRFAASSSPENADIWLNLARVHDRLGEQELAELAIGEYEALQSGPRPSALAARINVQWVEPENFNEEGIDQVPPRQRTPPRAARAPQKKAWPFR